MLALPGEHLRGTLIGREDLVEAVLNPAIAYNVLRYMVRVWESQLREHKALTPIIPTVVYHGLTRWKISTELQGMIGGVPEGAEEYVPNYRYHLVDLSQYSDDELQGEIWLQVALLAMKHIANPRIDVQLPAFVGLLKRLLAQPRGMDRLYLLMTYLTRGGQHVSEPAVQALLTQVLDATQKEEVMTTLAEQWVEQGLQQGLERGLQQGIQQALTVALEVRFGEAGRDFADELSALASLELLTEIQTALLSDESLESLRARFLPNDPGVL